ncbi:MAG: hypothetical protein KME21_21800 [Desmonostoc vinosum HA7617-LM4]|jgi:hypothetical protein|nr:hypothetical protein [Desmonostoc vinosum HA7617-LM4]
MGNRQSGRFDAEAWKFSIQVLFSAIVLGLCVLQIGLTRDKENIALYWGGLSSVLAYWLPSPTQSKDDKEQMTLTTSTIASANNNGNNGHSDPVAIMTQSTSTTEVTELSN